MSGEKKEFVDKLSEILVRNDIFTQEQAAAFRKNFEESASEGFDEFLIEEGIVPKEDILSALSEYYNVPSFDVTGHFFDTLLLHQFPKDFLLRCSIVPLEIEGAAQLFVVAANPESPGLESLIREYVSYDVNFLVGIRLDIWDAVKEFYDESPTAIPVDSDLRQEHQEELEVYQEMMTEEQEVLPLVDEEE